MKHLFLVLLSAVLGCSIVQTTFGQDKHHVHCLLLDKTLSMTGSGGGENIWPDVQEYCYTWADGIKAPCTIVFFTYARSLNGPQIFEIKSESDKVKIKNAVKNVKIDGRHTWIASNLSKTWDYLCEKYPESVKRIYLITDGKEEEMNSSIRTVVEKYAATRGDYDYLYYVDLNDFASQETKEIFEQTEGADHGKGFHKFYTVTPSYSEIDYVIGKSKVLRQRFIVEGDDISTCSFAAKIKSASSVGKNSKNPNVSIKQPTTVHFKDLAKDGDTYIYDFNIEFDNDTKHPCDIIIKLEGHASDNADLIFSPAEFKIEVRDKVKERVILKNNGWQIK